MHIYFIRHGDPNYKDNCLTETGHVQAEALAERIFNSTLRPDKIYSSKYGRAIETAEHTAKKLGMDVEILDFMHEIHTGAAGREDEQEKKYYSPWEGTPRLCEEGKNLATIDLEACDLYAGTPLPEEDARVIGGFDAWMETLGYKREACGYRCMRENKDKLFVFAHGGSISSLLGHFLGTNTLHTCGLFRLKCTSITEVEFKSHEGKFVLPLLRRVGDVAHMEEIVYSTPDN